MTEPMLSIVPGDLKPIDAYRLMLSVVVPRPIAWVSTLAPDGTPNLAPFSFFNGVCGHPPIVMISVTAARDRPEKDTLNNVRRSGEFVVHVVDEALAEAMNLTSGDWPAETDEFQVAGLAALPSAEIAPPRVAAAAVAMECRLHRIVPVEETRCTMILGRVLRYHIRQDLLRPSGTVDTVLLRPVARLSGEEYATIGRVFALRRPDLHGGAAAPGPGRIIGGEAETGGPLADRGGNDR